MSESFFFSLVRVAVRLYQWMFGWYTAGHCRFHPTCSEYFLDSVKHHGLIKGVGFGVWRVLRCQPFCDGGRDEVTKIEVLS